MSKVPDSHDENSSTAGAPARYNTATQRADRRWHRVLVLGMIGAIVVHVIAVLLFRSTVIPPLPDYAASGPNAGDLQAAEAGGTGLTMVELRVEQPPEEEVVEEVIPVPERIVVAEVPRPTPAPAPTVTPPSRQGTGGVGTGGDAGTTEGTGREDGDARGGGGGGGDGAAGVIAPVPRGMIIPPADRPRSVRGQEITVWVYVTDRGRVAADSTRLDPPTPDARYNTRLRRSASEWIFEPARQDGRAVGAWYPFQIIL